MSRIIIASGTSDPERIVDSALIPGIISKNGHPQESSTYREGFDS